MSPAVKPRLAAALEVTFLAAQCHKGTCLQPQADLGHTQTSLVDGVGLAMAKRSPHLSRRHKTPFRAAKTPLVCAVAPIIYLLLLARNGGMTVVASSVHHFPLGQHPSSQHSMHPCAWFLGIRLQRLEQQTQSRRVTSGSNDHRQQRPSQPELPLHPSNILVFPTPGTLISCSLSAAFCVFLCLLIFVLYM